MEALNLARELAFFMFFIKASFESITFYQFLAPHVSLILIFQYITQNYILAELTHMFMLCVVHDKFVSVFLFFVLLWTFVESDTNKIKITMSV